MKADFLKLNVQDLFKGLVVALLTAVITFFYEAIAAGKPLDLALLEAVGKIALAAGLGYLLKNLGTNSQNQLLVPEKKATPEVVKPVDNFDKMPDEWKERNLPKK